jgi:hypothetical protein
MKIYEYQLFRSSSSPDKRWRETGIHEINKMANEGWELLFYTHSMLPNNWLLETFIIRKERCDD